MSLPELARKYCIHFHKGQFRKGSNMPFYMHPIEVAGILDNYGYSDITTQCIAYLHDTLEDTELSTEELQERFGYEVANGVFVLSKNTINQESWNSLNRTLPFEIDDLSLDQIYKSRLAFARKKVKRVKLADMIHNTQDLPSLGNPKSIEKKINDANQFYIPMGREIAPLMVKELEENIENFHKSYS